MDKKNLVLGFLFEVIGICFILYFSNMGESIISNILKWVGVVLMIGGPLFFWEIIPLRKK